MRTQRLSRRLLVGSGAAILLAACIGAVTVATSNDFRCTGEERRPMSEFPHIDNAQPRWESNAKITGGCTTTFTVDAEPKYALAYYQALLRQHGWTVHESPANAFPIFFDADRNSLRYTFMFVAPETMSPSGESDALRDKRRTAESGEKAECRDCAPLLQPGQIRVSISGGQH